MAATNGLAYRLLPKDNEKDWRTSRRNPLEPYDICRDHVKVLQVARAADLPIEHEAVARRRLLLVRRRQDLTKLSSVASARPPAR